MLSLEKWEEYNHFLLIDNFHNPLYILRQPLSIVQYLYTSYIYTYLNNADLCPLHKYEICQYFSLPQASAYSAILEIVLNIYPVDDLLAIFWSSMPIKSEAGSGVLRREIMKVHGYYFIYFWLWNKSHYFKRKIRTHMPKFKKGIIKFSR